MYALRKEKETRRETLVKRAVARVGAVRVAVYALLLAGSITLACGGWLSSPASPDQLRSMTAHLYVSVETNAWGQASGVFVRGKDQQLYLFTAAHCVPEEPGARLDVQVHPLDSTNLPPRLTTTVVHVDRTLDFALLRLNSIPTEYRVAKLSKRPARTRDKVQHVGFFGGDELPHAYVMGWVTQTGRQRFPTLSHPLDVCWMYTTGGSSGGGMFNWRGELVGIVSASNRAGITLYQPIDLIRESLREAGLSKVF